MEKLSDVLAENGYETTFVFEGKDDAFLGVSHHWNAIYDADKFGDDSRDVESCDGDLQEPIFAQFGKDVKIPEGSGVLTEGYYADAVIGLTEGGNVIYGYDELVEVLKSEYIETDGKREEDLTDDEHCYYTTSAMEWIDYNIIRSLDYNLANGGPMPIVMHRIDYMR